MKTFTRYLIHFSIIGAVVFIIGTLLVINDKSINNRFSFYLAIAICIYIIPMALFCGKLSQKSEIKVNKEYGYIIDFDRIFLIHPLYKKVKNENNDTVVYTYSNRYCAWLAGSVTVKEYDDYYIVIAPKSYIKQLNSPKNRIPL